MGQNKIYVLKNLPIASGSSKQRHLFRPSFLQTELALESKCKQLTQGTGEDDAKTLRHLAECIVIMRKLKIMCGDGAHN